MDLHLSAIDQQRFGIITAKATLAAGADLAAMNAWCRAQQVEMLIVRCPSDALALAQGLEEHGCRLMDSLVYFGRATTEPVAPALPATYHWRFATPEDASAVEALAVQAFAAYGGHYHADARLARTDADLVYSSWAASSCRHHAVANAVLLILQDQELAGFLTLKRLDNGDAEIVLNGIAPAHQGRGLYGALVTLARNWSAQQGCTRLLVSTQLTNIAPQKTWCRQGFEPLHSYYTFHKWFIYDPV